MVTRLSLATLGSLGPMISVPAYRREQLRAGIVHIGLGNFHRAHEALYMDRLFNKGRDLDWAIVGTGVMPGDAKMVEALSAQDYLTTVVEQEAGSSTARVTGSMVGMIAPGDKRAIIARLADPDTRIVSLTVTEGGYFINPATGKFDPTAPAIVHDALQTEHPETAFGLIVLGLARRRAAGLNAFTVMCCDNIPHNGDVTRNAVVGLARLSDPDLAAWIERTATFPNAMVDRITPATTDRERAKLKEDWGIEDNWPVYCEEFIQWVLEDKFCNGRPAFDAVGAEFVPDVTPYEFMKIRILNGGHAAIAYPASLFGIHFVHDAMNHPLVGGFFKKIEQDEIMPTVPPVPNTDLQDYYKLIHRRFSNPKIGDTIPRLAFDGSNRQPKFIVPVIRDRLKAGGGIDGLALESALWCRHCAGTTETGEVIKPNDPIWDRLTATATKATSDPMAWLGMTDIYGDVGSAPQMREAFARWLPAIWTKGPTAVLQDYLGTSA